MILFLLTTATILLDNRYNFAYKSTKRTEADMKRGIGTQLLALMWIASSWWSGDTIYLLLGLTFSVIAVEIGSRK
jgi:hypothetical protein